MDPVLEAIIEAIGTETHIWMRTNKGAALPFEIIDRSGDEPVVLSAWADYTEACAKRRHADLAKRGSAALSAIEGMGLKIVGREPTEQMLAAAADPIWEFSPEYALTDKDPAGEHPDSAEHAAKAAWRAMFDAAPPRPVEE